MSVLVVVLGGLTGLHAATWGAFKDTPFEGFRGSSFVRSVVLGLGLALVVGSTLPKASSQAVVVLVGLLYAAERLATEWWKAFVREDPQSAYAIPMRLAVGGRPVDARLPRYATGIGLLVGLLALVRLLSMLPREGSPGWVTVLVGGTGGWLTAVGGAWKDAPVEGFSGWKFLRSPAVATGWALALAPQVTDWLLLVVSAGGLSVLVIETYKTFLTGGRPPGKFHGKPVRFVEWTARRRCRALHCLLCGALAVVVLGSLSAFLPVAGTVAVAMLMTDHRSVVPAGTTTREPDADAELRRERA